ncbi:HNH endonuclease [Rhodococcus hoagii]|nr:HNH endonuclease [Prescottella equi]
MFDKGVSIATADEGLSALSEALVARHTRIAGEQFLEIDQVTDLFVMRCEEDARAGRNEAHHGEFAHVEVAGVLGLTEAAAQRMIGLGCDLRWRLHQVRAAFACGRIDLAKAHALSEALANVSDDVLADIERRLLDGAERVSTTGLRARARRLIARLDPEGARERRRHAVADRDVRVIAREDAMAQVDGLLPAEGGQILAGRLRAMSFDVCARDPRTYPQRRADALVALASGHAHLECRCGFDNCTARTGLDATGTPGVAVHVHVGVSASTLLGLDDAPGYLSGYGPIDADLARELAADATWKQVLTLSDADRAELATDAGSILGIGRSLPAPRQSPEQVASRTRKRLQELTYRPTGRLAEIVRTRDGVCRFPNCATPAASCDLDHTIPFDHDDASRGGLTAESNLACLCRKHHRLKTLGYWIVRQIGQGRLEWSDPTGRITITEPQGMFVDGSRGDDLRAGVGSELLARLTDGRTIAKLNYSAAEGDLDYLLESLIPPRQRRRRGHAPRHTGKAATASTGIAAEEDPPF